MTISRGGSLIEAARAIVVPDSLPATLLERRPDIAAAQRRVAAAYLQIGVADAAFFPSLTLSGSATYRNSVIGNLFSAPNLTGRSGLAGPRDPRRRPAPARERRPAQAPIRRRPTTANRC